MMALNRYRLRHLAKSKHRGAERAQRLLERPDRLIGLILLGNNFVNILASALATVIALRVMGEPGIAVAAGLLTLVILIFAEVTPKTLAAWHPERVAFPASLLLLPLLRILSPLVWVVNWMASGVLLVFGVRLEETAPDRLSRDELRTVVNEAGALLSRRYKRMLVSILDLEKVTVEDIMVPRSEISAIDLDDPLSSIADQIMTAQHAALPLYRGDINNVTGILVLRKLLPSMQRTGITEDELMNKALEPYFVPAGTPLSTQLLNFQRQQRRIGLVVDEYGDIEGLVALEDILEEIVGEFTTDPASQSPDVHPQADGSYLVDGTATVRELNRTMRWELPADGPKTINGLILEYLEAIPEPGTGLLLAGYPVEIVQTSGNAVRTARIHPQKRRPVA